MTARRSFIITHEHIAPPLGQHHYSADNVLDKPSEAMAPPPLRRIHSTSAVPLQSTQLISFETTHIPLPTHARPPNLRRLPSVSIHLDRKEAQPEQSHDKGNHDHGSRDHCSRDHCCRDHCSHDRSSRTHCSHERSGHVRLVVQRNSPRHITTHTLSIDMWLFKILLILSMLGTVSGLVLTSSPARSMGIGGGVGRAGRLTMDLDGADYHDVYLSAAAPEFAHLAAQAAAAPTSRSPLDESFGVAAVRKAREGIFPREPLDSAGAREIRGRVVPRRATASGTRLAAKAEAAPVAEAATDTPNAPPGRRLYSATEVERALAEHDGLAKTVLVFGAKSCRTCRLVQPKMERMAGRAGARFLYVYHDATTSDVFRAHDVKQTPTVLVYDDAGALIDRAAYSTADLPRFESLLGVSA